MTRARGVFVDVSTQNVIKALIAEHGESIAAQRLGLSPITMIRAAHGYAVQSGTVALLRQALQNAATATAEHVREA